MKYKKGLFLIPILSIISFTIFGEITSEDIKSIDIRMLCYAFAVGSGELRSNIPNDICNRISNSIHEIIKYTDNQSISGKHTYHAAGCGCEVYWSRNADNLKFEGFGYNKDDCIDNIRPPIPPHPFTGKDGSYVLENTQHSEKNNYKNEVFKNNISQNLKYDQRYLYQFPSPLESITSAIKENVNFNFSINPSITDRIDNMKRHARSDKCFYIDVEFNTRNSRPTNYQICYELDERTIKQFKQSTAADFKKAFEEYYFNYQNRELETLMRFEFYQFPEFIKYIRTLIYYESFILSLENTIVNNPEERHILDYIQGFKCRSKFILPGIGKTNSEFRKWVHKEADSIRKSHEEQAKLLEKKIKAQKLETEYQKIAEELEELSKKRKLFHEKVKKEAVDQKIEQEKFESLDDDINLADKLETQISFEETLNSNYSFAELEDFLISQSKLHENSSKLHTISKLGLSYLKNAQEAFDNRSFEDFKRNKDRANIIATYLNNPNYIFDYKYDMGKNAINMLQEGLSRDVSDKEYDKKILDEVVNNYAFCNGNYLQHHLNKELLTTITQAADLYDAYSTDPYISNFVRLVNLSAESARQCKLSEEYEQGFTLSDYSDALLKVGKKYSQLIENGIWALYKPAEVITKGVAQGLLSTAEQYKNLLAHPIDTTINYFIGIGKLALLGTKAAMLAYNDQEQFLAKCKQILDTCVQNITSNPEQASIDLISSLTELTLVGKFKNSLVTKLGVIKPVVDIVKMVKEEIKVAKTAIANAAKAGIEHPNVQKLLSPIQEIAKETKEVLKVAMENGINATKKVINELQHGGQALVGNSSVSLIIEALTQFKDKLPKVNWAHLFAPEIKGKRIHGFHSRRSRTDIPITRIVQPKNEHGVYGAYYSYMGKEKYSTFFPDHWDSKTLLKKIKEAYNNKVQITKDNGFIGKTSEGIEIQFWYEKTKSGEIILSSIYPHILTK